MRTAALALAALIAAAPALADTASAIRAMKAGLYDVAANELLREAKQGDAEAQYQLGTMYLTGTWFPADRDEAMHWFAAAAIQGHAGALEKVEELGRDEQAATPK